MTDVILHSSGKKKLPSAPPISETNSKLIGTGSTVQTLSNTEKPNSSSGNSKSPTVAAQSPPLSPIPVAPAINPAKTRRPIHIPDPSDIDPPFPLPPPRLIETVARKSKSFSY